MGVEMNIQNSHQERIKQLEAALSNLIKLSLRQCDVILAEWDNSSVDRCRAEENLPEEIAIAESLLNKKATK